MKESDPTRNARVSPELIASITGPDALDERPTNRPEAVTNVTEPDARGNVDLDLDGLLAEFASSPPPSPSRPPSSPLADTPLEEDFFNPFAEPTPEPRGIILDEADFDPLEDLLPPPITSDTVVQSLPGTVVQAMPNAAAQSLPDTVVQAMPEPLPETPTPIPTAPKVAHSFDALPDFGTEEHTTVDAPPIDVSQLQQTRGNDDRGAAAAKRTVRYRKPRAERFPLVGRSGDALRARADLLRVLSESRTGPARAKLLVAAAELLEAHGDVVEASGLYAAARTADPKNLIAMRAVRRDAVGRGAWPEVARLYETEASLVSSGAERAMVLSALAELYMTQLTDAESAERVAREALASESTCMPAALVLAEACFAKGSTAEAFDALERAAASVADRRISGALLSQMGQEAEDHGLYDRARTYYGRAIDAEPSAIDALFGLARTSLTQRDVNTAASALETAAARTRTPALTEGLRRMAAQLYMQVDRASEAAALLRDARSIPALRMRVRASKTQGDGDAYVQALEALAAAAGGSERAETLVELAEVLAERNDVEGADAALRDAALSDNTLGTVRVVREMLSRRGGAAARLSRATEMREASQSGGALAAAARVARHMSAVDRERDLLDRAVEQGESPISADVLALDAAAAAGDTAEIEARLRRQADRAAHEAKVGPLLTLAEQVARRTDSDHVRVVLDEAREASTQNERTIVLRALARRHGERAPDQAASMWLEESTNSTGDRAAFAALQAARSMSDAAAASNALQQALTASPAYGPALWAYEPLARSTGETATLEQFLVRNAELLTDTTQAAEELVRAAFLRSEVNPSGAAELFEKAFAAHPRDTILHELLFRVSEPPRRGALLEASAAELEGSFATAARVRAAAMFEHAGEYARAAGLYRTVLSEQPDNPYARVSLDRVELRAGEQARVAERRFQAVRDAEDDSEERVMALEALAQLDLNERGDAASAVLSLASILETAEGHLPSLRALERYFMENQRDEDLLPIEERLVEHLEDVRAASSHARLAARLKLRATDADGAAADTILLAAASRAEVDLWLARRVEGVARSGGKTALLAWASEHVAARLASPIERAAGLLRAAEVAATAKETAALLEPAVHAAPDHPLTAEVLAQSYEAGGLVDRAAETFEIAAKAACSPKRIASLWHRAAVLWQDRNNDFDRAITALTAAAQHDIGHADVFERLRRLLNERGQTNELAELISRRLAAGGETSTLVALHEARADLAERVGDRDMAIKSLRAALALDSTRANTLHKLAELCIETGDWRGAAEALIHIARLRKDAAELRWVFFTLGDIYDTHMPDARRAEAAYKRVLKLMPDDMETMRRLATLYRREGNYAEAVLILRQLASLETRHDHAAHVQLNLAEALEKLGDERQAEQVLDQARRNAPTDRTTLRALADFYERQQAHSALSMHLNRAVSDLRRVIDEDFGNGLAWNTLVEVLSWRGRTDAARCCASAALALYSLRDEALPLLDENGGVPGARRSAADPELDEDLAPSMITPGVRTLFQLASDSLEKALPFDLKSARAEKLPARDHAFRGAADEVSQWFGLSELPIYVSDGMPRACFPVSSLPPAILIGRELYTTCDEREQRFLLARAVKIARSNLAVAVTSAPAAFAVTFAALVRLYDQGYTPPGMDPAVLEEATRRMQRTIARKIRDELGPLVLEVGGTPGFDAGTLGRAAAELGDRAALLATGSVPAAVDALLRAAGHAAAVSPREPVRVQTIQRLPETAALLTFSISDAYFEARSRVGADKL